MAGHSKWSNIRHRKERQDQKRGKVWSKCSRAIMAAARSGGGDPASNLGLRYAIEEAKAANMPKDTIQRAIDKGAGAAGGENFEEGTYEGYGPGGVAILVDTLTDNKTRTFNEVRTAFSKNGGNLGTSGSVGFMFETKGRLLIAGNKATEEQLMEVAIEAGAEDVQEPEPDADDPGYWTVLTEATAFIAVKEAVDAAGIACEEAEVARIPLNLSACSGDDVRKLMNLIDALEDNDDVQKVWHNAELSDEALAALG